MVVVGLLALLKLSDSLPHNLNHCKHQVPKQHEHSFKKVK
jgi:hypothetical protein